jgi:hypothetical protein
MFVTTYALLLPFTAGIWLLLVYAKNTQTHRCCCCCYRCLWLCAAAASSVVCPQEDPNSLAEIPPDVLVMVLRQLPLSMRLREGSLVCRTWRAAAAVATHDLQLVPPTASSKACAFQSWLVQHGSSLTALTIRSTYTSPHNQGVQLPFQQLRSLRKLWATDACLFDLVFAADPAGAQGSSSSSSDSGNPLSALTSLAELSLQRSLVLGEPGALHYLPALGASLTRLRLAHVSFRW